MTSADTYRPLPFTPADLRRLRKAFRAAHAPGVGLDLYHTDAGEPFVSVTDPRLTWEEDTWIIIRGEVTGRDGTRSLGWQMHRGGERPLYEFASEREVAEFFCRHPWQEPMPFNLASRQGREFKAALKIPYIYSVTGRVRAGRHIMIIELWLIIGCIGILALRGLWRWASGYARLFQDAVAAAQRDQIVRYENEMANMRAVQAFQDWRSMPRDGRPSLVSMIQASSHPGGNELLPGD